MDNFQFGYKQKLPPPPKPKKTLEGGGQQRENGQAAWAPQPPPCVLAGSSQSGRAAKKGKEGRKKLFSLSRSISLSLSPLLSREIYLFCSLCFVLLTKSECVVASFFRRIVGSPSPRHFPSPCLHSQFLSSFVLCVCVCTGILVSKSLSVAAALAETVLGGFLSLPSYLSLSLFVWVPSPCRSNSSSSFADGKRNLIQR